jgi:hypothetical protein
MHHNRSQWQGDTALLFIMPRGQRGAVWRDSPPASSVATTGFTNRPVSAGTYIWKVSGFLVVLVAVMLELDTSPRAVAANVTDLHARFNTGFGL